MTTSNQSSGARVWAAIDLAAVRSNARTVAEFSGARLLPMIKANAYGLGSIPIAHALEALDPWGYGVATIEEALELRRAKITRALVVFTPFHPSQLDIYHQNDLRPAMGDLPSLRAWTSASKRPFHIEIDSGMSRAGFRWNDAALMAELASILTSAPEWEGLFTHFHSVDEIAPSVPQQWDRFQGALRLLPRKPPLVHAANSAAALADRRYGADLVRPGIFLFGGEAGGRYPSTVVRLESRVVAVRRIAKGDTVSYGASWIAEEPATIATLAVGYADGLPRSLSNRGKVEINGVMAPIAGRVTMDMTMLALPERDPVAVGDTATIFGGRMTLDQQAAAAGTISYEMLTRLGSRVERRYHESTA
ncbi:MAG: alanine racemase [Gemmatimonadota bacterium]